MNDYIEREAALSEQNKSMNLSECRKRLERIPAADVAPVVHGRWEITTHDDGYGKYRVYRCDRCGAFEARQRNYCHNCGARMMEGNDANE